MVNDRRRRPGVALALLLAGAAVIAGCGAPAAAPPKAAEALRNCGADVPLVPPERIFAAFQNGIEAVYALGAGDRVVGAAYLDNRLPQDIASRFHPQEYFPEEYPSREEVLRLAPDLVVSGFTGAVSREGLGTRAELAALGANAYVFRSFCPSVDGAGQTSLAANDASLESVYADLSDLGRLLGEPDRATGIVERMRATVASTQERLAGVAERPRVAMVNRPGGSGPMRVFGTGDVATTIIETAGGTQAFPEIDGRMKRVDTEALIAARPDVIVVPSCCGADEELGAATRTIAELRADPALAQVPAVRDGRLVPITFAEISPGIRNADAVATLARVLHPDRFGR
ncbi:ABC transporter substrate-binding protein [Pseudonocardia endophytica]|uniref:Iron complex transport system substrate-binding protein n=1 Tax=Pseudonocardia endophytica TaxID=401976 RepID=A0A4R1HVX5_PSEEN|nr:ABC transporter substrate-binding protein [Pseudonocardia endophytica]TCK24880.1 iron complex transport system substrate-binding protein [Pseudonocardia endophytica]